MRGSGVFSSSEQQKSPQKSEHVQNTQVLAKLQEQIVELTSENRSLHAQLDAFNEKLQKREQEINRLSKLSLQVVSSGDDSSRKLREQDQEYADQALQEAADLQMDQLQAQMDLLNDQVAKYESRLKEANDQLRRNNGLEEDLQ